MLKSTDWFEYIQIYPNPNDGNMTFVYETNEPAELQIMDVVGNIICTYMLAETNTSITINCAELSNGIYLYKILARGNIVKADKIIILK